METHQQPQRKNILVLSVFPVPGNTSLLDKAPSPRFRPGRQVSGGTGTFGLQVSTFDLLAGKETEPTAISQSQGTWGPGNGGTHSTPISE